MQSSVPADSAPDVLDQLRATFRADWVVYAKAPFGGADKVFAYLGRYTHRVGISNSRILAMDDRGVTFFTKGDRQCSLPGVEFLRRFVDHVLPSGLHAHPSLRPRRAVPRDHDPREGARVAHACDGHTRPDRPSLHRPADRPRDPADVDRHVSRADRHRSGTLPSVHHGAPTSGSPSRCHRLPSVRTPRDATDLLPSIARSGSRFREARGRRLRA